MLLVLMVKRLFVFPEGLTTICRKLTEMAIPESNWEVIVKNIFGVQQGRVYVKAS